ncbi:MAG TPA: hypothetical protein VFT02_03800 [Pyrinomonadaceae bacterium]|nr:hypothetical protein [Pyrinomonadaceae bacterium]
MADDRMKNDDLDRNLGGAGQRNKDDFGQQSPGRHKQDDLSTGQRGQGGQGQQNQPKDNYNIDDDDFGTGQTGGGQRDRNQNR